MSKFDTHNRLEKKYSPDQERDERGRFGSGGGNALPGSSTDKVSQGIAKKLTAPRQSVWDTMTPRQRARMVSQDRERMAAIGKQNKEAMLRGEPVSRFLRGK